MKINVHDFDRLGTRTVSDIGINATIPRKAIQIKKIMVVDDHTVTRQKVRNLIEETSHLCVIGETPIVPDALEMISGMKPDMVIIGIAAAGSINGISFIKTLKERFPHVKVLVLAMFDESLFAERALRGGANGYITEKEAVSKKIIKAIGAVLKGDLFISEQISKMLIARLINGAPDTANLSLEELTSRETEIFQLVGRGFSTKEIAHMLKLSIFTVESHKKHIRKKLNIKDSPQMLKTAIQWMIMNNNR